MRTVSIPSMARPLGLSLREAEIIITWSLRPEQFTLAKNLRWIHSPAAAVHQLMFPELVWSDVVLTNAREELALIS